MPERVVHAIPRRTVIASLSCLALLLRSGVPLLRALEVLADQADPPGFRHLLQTMGHDLESGRPLSFAMRSHPRTFSSVQVALTEAAEEGGLLPETLDRMVVAETRQLRLADRLRAASVYPLVVLGVCLVVLTLLSQVLVRSTAGLFEAAGHPLPLATRGLLLLTSPLGLMLGALMCVAAGAVVKSWLSTEEGYRQGTDRLLAMPALGKAVLHLEVATMLRSLAALYSAGVSLLTGLTIVSQVTRFPILREGVERVRADIELGRNLSDALAGIPVLPAAVHHFVRVGETTGALAEMLVRLADWYDQEVDHAIDVLTAALEPALICSMGLIVGIIVVVAFAPVYQLMSRIAL